MLLQAGLDSLGAVEFRNAVSAAFAIDVPATAAFDYPTIAFLAAHICSQVTVPCLSWHRLPKIPCMAVLL